MEQKKKKTGLSLRFKKGSLPVAIAVAAIIVLVVASILVMRRVSADYITPTAATAENTKLGSSATKVAATAEDATALGVPIAKVTAFQVVTPRSDYVNNVGPYGPQTTYRVIVTPVELAKSNDGKGGQVQFKAATKMTNYDKSFSNHTYDWPEELSIYVSTSQLPTPITFTSCGKCAGLGGGCGNWDGLVDCAKYRLATSTASYIPDYSAATIGFILKRNVQTATRVGATGHNIYETKVMSLAYFANSIKLSDMFSVPKPSPTPTPSPSPTPKPTPAPSPENCAATSNVTASTLNAQEKAAFGDRAKVYAVKTIEKAGQNKTFRLVVAATKFVPNSSGEGGTVTFKVGLGNFNNFVYTEKDGSIWLIPDLGHQKLAFDYGNPNLAVGAYWTKELSWPTVAYDVPITAKLVNGSDQYVVACINNVINLKDALAAPSPTPTPSPSPTPTPKPSPSPSPSPSPTPTPSPSPTPIPVCTDSDGGDIYKKGTVTKGSITKTDECMGSMLAEYFCSNNEIAVADTNCPGGCSDGKCKPVPSPTITPSKTPSPSPTPKPSPSPSVVPSASPITSLVPMASVAANTLSQGIKTIYFNDLNLDTAIHAKKNSTINFNWGTQSPVSGIINENNWSDLSTSRILAPTTGIYDIGVTHNDGVRVWLGGRKIIDDWTDWKTCAANAGATCDNALKVNSISARVYMEQGKMYSLKVEHYDKSDEALLKLYWRLPGAKEGVLIPSSAFFTDYDDNPAHGEGTGLLGTYYNLGNFDQYMFWRKDNRINFDWGSSAPRNDMNAKSFSVRWTGKVRARFSETYNFNVTAKDGVKLWVNNELIIDKWRAVSTPTTYTGPANLTAGRLYPIQIEYYSAGTDAAVDLKWQSPSERLGLVPTSDLYYPGAPNISVTPSPTPTPSPSPTPSKTPSPTPTPSKAPSPTPTPSKVPSATPTPSKTPSPTPTPSKTPSPTPTPSVTATPLRITMKSGWNAISIPDASKPVLAKPLTTDPYDFLTFAFNAAENNARVWNTSPSIFNNKTGYYVKNTSSKDVVVTFENSSTGGSTILYRGWNLIANTSTSAAKLSTMKYTKKTCTDNNPDPIHCQGYLNDVSLGDLNYGRAGEDKAAFTKIYYIAKPYANNQTPDPFTIFDVVKEGGPSAITIPGRNPEAGQSGIFWLYLFD